MKKIEIPISTECIIYCRVSSDEQIKGTSLDDQERICLDYANRHKLNVFKIYKENSSARYANARKMFNNMMKEFREGKAQVLICAMCDRLSRNGGDAYALQQMIEDNDLTVVVVTDDLILKKPLEDDVFLMFDIKNVFSAHELRVIKRRCCAGILAKSLQGFRPTRVPYGYTNDKAHNTAIIVESRAKFVRKAFELCAENNLTIVQIAKELYAQGYKYEASRFDIIPKQSLYSMLRNLFYTGEYIIKRTGELQKGNHKPIVSKELFEKVQKVINTNPNATRKNNLLYSRLLKCDACGYYMVGDVKERGEKTYVYFACTNQNCFSKVRTTEVKIEDSVHSYLKEIRLELIPNEIVEEVLKEELSELKQQLSILKRKVSHRFTAEQQLHKHIHKNGIVDEKYIQACFAEIQEKYGNLDSKIYIVETQISTITKRVHEILQTRLFDVYKGYDIETKRKVLELITNCFKYNEKGLKMTFKPAFRKIRRRYAISA